MTSDRPYARARTISEGIEELIACKGTHFDPKIVDAFVHVLDRQHAPSRPHSAPAPSVVSAPVA
jgi:HD-GYP domain-containing protein (c-di-GMP phosphodiesterase class II)